MTTEQRTDWWPLPDGPFPLIDGWMDGSIEERCWVPVRVVDGPAYAEERAQGGRDAAIHAFLKKTLDYAYEALADDHATLILVEGTTWQRPEGKPHPNGGYTVPTEDPCDDHDTDEEPCSRCLGTGKMHLRYDEGCPWATCEPTDEGAVEFYVLEVTDA